MSASGITLLVGTTKGAFLVDGGDDRQHWSVRGPFCDGWPINHGIGDPETGALWAGGGGEWSGAGVWHSADGGDHWQVVRLTRGSMDDWAANDPEFAQTIGWRDGPLPFADSFQQIWSLCHAHGVLDAGTKPASLLASRDGGRTFERVQSLNDHPSSDSWNGGAAGLVLHSIVAHPSDARRLWLGISAAGVFAIDADPDDPDNENTLATALMEIGRETVLWRVHDSRSETPVYRTAVETA